MERGVSSLNRTLKLEEKLVWKIGVEEVVKKYFSFRVDIVCEVLGYKQ